MKSQNEYRQSMLKRLETISDARYDLAINIAIKLIRNYPNKELIEIAKILKVGEYTTLLSIISQ